MLSSIDVGDCQINKGVITHFMLTQMVQSLVDIVVVRSWLLHLTDDMNEQIAESTDMGDQLCRFMGEVDTDFSDNSLNDDFYGFDVSNLLKVILDYDVK